MIGMVADPELPPNDRRHSLGGPDLPPKAEVLRAPRQQGRELVPLLVRQLRRRPRRHPPLQRLDPALTNASHPLADRSGGHPECRGDCPLTPALLLQLPGAQPPAFAPLTRRPSFRLHTSERRTGRANFSFLHGDQ